MREFDPESFVCLYVGQSTNLEARLCDDVRAHRIRFWLLLHGVLDSAWWTLWLVPRLYLDCVETHVGRWLEPTRGNRFPGSDWEWRRRNPDFAAPCVDEECVPQRDGVYAWWLPSEVYERVLAVEAGHSRAAIAAIDEGWPA